MHNVMLAEFEGESVLLDTDSGNYFAINEAGLKIWKLVQAGQDWGAVVSEIASEYGLTKEKANSDVREFLNLLQAKGLCRVPL